MILNPSAVVSSRSSLRSRRDLLRATAATTLSAAALGTSGAIGAAAGCGRAARPRVEEGRVVVTFWYAFGDLVRKVLLEMVGRFNASQTRITVRALHQGDYFETLAKLRAAIAAGTPPTLSHVVLEVLPYLARAGVLEALDAYEGALTTPFVSALSQRGSFAKGGGEPLVGIPFNRSTPILYANRRIVDDEHASLPTTWDDLANTARALTRRSPSGEVRWGLEVPISWWYWVAMVGQGGGRLVEPDGRMSLGGKAGEDALRFWQRLVHDDRVMRPPPGRDYQAWQSTHESFLQERIAMMWSSTAFVRYLEANARFPVVAAPLPQAARFSVPTGGTMFVLLRDAPAEEKRAAWEFVRWMTDVEQTVAFSTRTGYLPVTRPAAERLIENGWYARHPNDRVAYDQLSSVEPWPWAPDLFRVERDVVEPLLEDAVRSGRDAHDVMDQARDEAGTPP